jgi:hypothetical protein
MTIPRQHCDKQQGIMTASAEQESVERKGVFPTLAGIQCIQNGPIFH